MNLERAIRITKQFKAGKTISMQPNEMYEYKKMCDDAISWLKNKHPAEYYDIIYKQLIRQKYIGDQSNKCCETCYYWGPFTGVCRCACSPNGADFTDDDDLCAFWADKTKKLETIL